MASLLVTICMLLLASTQFVASRKDYTNEELQQLRLTPIGSFEGVAYFRYDSLASWTNATAYCNSLEMQLVAISSVALNNWLKANIYLVSNTYYWTSGRDRGTRDQYLWNTGNGDLINGVTFYADARRSCVAFLAGSSYGYWYGYDCAVSRYAICQNS